METKETYFTFGSGMYNNKGTYPLKNKYCKTTRNKIYEATNGMFAFEYTWEQFEHQITEYNLTKINVRDLRDVILI